MVLGLAVAFMTGVLASNGDGRAEGSGAGVDSDIDDVGLDACRDVGGGDEAVGAGANGKASGNGMDKLGPLKGGLVDREAGCGGKEGGAELGRREAGGGSAARDGCDSSTVRSRLCRTFTCRDSLARCCSNCAKWADQSFGSCKSRRWAIAALSTSARESP